MMNMNIMLDLELMGGCAVAWALTRWLLIVQARIRV